MALESFHEALTPETLEQLQSGVAWLHAQAVPLRDAKISIMTHAFLYGTAVHEGIRGYLAADGKQIHLFRVCEHYERMKRNGRILKIAMRESVPDLVGITTALLRANRFQTDCYVRAIAYKSGLQIGLRLADLHDLAIFALPQGRFHADKQSVAVCVSSWRRVEDNAVPARAKINGAYVNSALAMTEALDNGFDDAIFLNEDGHVCEGSGMNLFLVKRGRLVTPTAAENILEGITRDTIIELGTRELRMETEVRPVDRSELYTADELFFCGTGMEVMPIHSVDHRLVGAGSEHPVSERLRALYFQIVRAERPDYAAWLTAVHTGEE